MLFEEFILNDCIRRNMGGVSTSVGTRREQPQCRPRQKQVWGFQEAVTVQIDALQYAKVGPRCI